MKRYTNTPREREKNRFAFYCYVGDLQCWLKKKFKHDGHKNSKKNSFRDNDLISKWLYTDDGDDDDYDYDNGEMKIKGFAHILTNNRVFTALAKHILNKCWSKSVVANDN